MLINHPHPLYSLQSRLSTAYEVIFAYTEVFHFLCFMSAYLCYRRSKRNQNFPDHCICPITLSVMTDPASGASSQDL